MVHYAKRFAFIAALGCTLVLSQGCTNATALNAQTRSAFNSDRAFGYLKAVCDLGPRPSGSEAMQKMQSLVTEHCEKLGAKVERQSFVVRHPEDGTPVTMTNLIVRWQPELSDRILLCAHYDTRPFPDRDPIRPRGVFIGANDGGSGVALCMEMAHAFSKEKMPVGVDFVLFDGEEFLFDEQRDRELYFLGSTYFAEQVAAGAMPGKYRKGALVDMIADKELDLYYERNSMLHASQVCKEIWDVAKRLRIREFLPRERHDVRDDHIPLNTIAKIPTADLIDFDYPKPGSRDNYWHTEKDRLDKCSGESICKVADVLLEWIRSQK